MSLDLEPLANILEACLLVAGKPMSMTQLQGLFEHTTDKPDKNQIVEALTQLQQSYENRGIELVEVASGFRLQARQSMAQWVTHMFQEKTPRYSRALMETLVLIAYRQPITRGEIEDVRGVAVSSNIIRTLLERDWVRVLGHRDVPGRPAILGTTRQFLDYFNLKRIDELPTLSEIKALDQIDPELAHEMALLEATEAEQTDTDSTAANQEADADSSGQAIDPVNLEHLDVDLGFDAIADDTGESPENEQAGDGHNGDEHTGDEPATDETPVAEDYFSRADAPDEDMDPDENSSGEFVVSAELADADSTSHEPLGQTEMGGSETLH